MIKKIKELLFGKPEYIVRNGVTFQLTYAYSKKGDYVACNTPYHYLDLGINMRV